MLPYRHKVGNRRSVAYMAEHHGCAPGGVTGHHGGCKIGQKLLFGMA